MSITITNELNKILHLNFLDNTLPDKCANLIIADPPYFEVKGDFDFIWSDFNQYLQEVEKWALECKRLLADNGTLFWWGMDRKIAYSQIILDKYFFLIGTPIWEKPSNPNEWDTRRTFPERGAERLLMYSAVEESLNITECVFYIRDYIRDEIQKSKGKIILKEVNKALGTATNGGGVASACLSLDKTEPAMVTKEIYEKLQKWCYPYLRKEYEDLRKEYEDLRKELEYKRRYFKNTLSLTDVFRFSRENNKYEHDTKKPEKLTRALIMTCSRENDLVIVPFAGSGTECAMSAKENRNFVGFEITKKHVDMSNKRVKKILDNPYLF